MKSVSLPIFSEVKAAAEKPLGWPLLRLGFRPFYLGGALVAALWVPLWLMLYLGHPIVAPALPALLWHAHEMLFGFALAIVIGFLLTAGKNWTGLPTPRGPALGALALLWMAARLASLLGTGGLYALLDVLLLPIVATLFARLLWRAGNRRNLPLAGILLLLALANAVFHAAALGWLDVSALTPLYAGLALITMIECVMAGRVIPAFTMATQPGLRLVAQPWLERSALTLTALGLAWWVLAPPHALGAGLLGASAVVQFWRFRGWRWRLSLSRPILWILHAAYLWIPVGLTCLALGQVGVLASAVGVHALALGATGGLIIGMITRTARGHTGRALQVSRLEVGAYLLVMVAALVRLAGALLPAAWYPMTLMLAATAWSLAFGLYLLKYTPWLLQTRLDGKDG